MSREKSTPILPPGQKEERPLFVIMMIMAFLAALTLMLTLMGLRQSASWQNDLKSAATVQLTGNDNLSNADQAARILKDLTGVRSATIVSEQENRALLGPWIGDLDLPEDIAIPILIRLDVDEARFDSVSADSALAAAGIEASVDNHRQWSKNLSSTWARIRFALLGLLTLILVATIAISSFATQSVLQARQNIINVLGQVGATDRFIARLFVTRFLSLGFKAAVTGAVLALLFMAGFMVLQNTGTDETGLKLGLGLSDFIWLVILAVIMGVISAMTAGYAARKSIQRQL